MSSYKEKFLDPRWQKKRLLILERDEWTCRLCGEISKTLHIHHKFYIFGVEPWDYSDDILETLCVDCHEIEWAYKQMFNNDVHSLLQDGWTYEQLGQLLAAIMQPLDYDRDERVRWSSFVGMVPEYAEWVKEKYNASQTDPELPF